MVELEELEDVITNMFMAESKTQLLNYTIIAITLILKIKTNLEEEGKNG